MPCRGDSLSGRGVMSASRTTYLRAAHGAPAVWGTSPRWMPVSASFHNHSGGCQQCCWCGLLATRGVGVGDCHRSCWSEVAARAALPQCSGQG
eukprot:3120230-Amphidinium_carterae.1